MDLSGGRFAVSEFLGTFLLVLAGPGAVVVDSVSGGCVGHLGVSVSFGLAVMVCICAFGRLSGSHINPAVTLAFASKGALAWRLVPVYFCLLSWPAPTPLRAFCVSSSEMSPAWARRYRRTAGGRL